MKNSKSNTSEVTNSYASALFDLFLEEKIQDTLRADIGTIVELFELKDVKRLTNCPLYERIEIAETMMKIGEHLGLCGIAQRFLYTVAKARRLSIVPQICEKFFALLDEEYNVRVITVETASPLGMTRKKKIASIFTQAFGGNATIIEQIKPDLLGGIVVRFDSIMIDCSLRLKILAVQKLMKGATL
jgi:F-type H+-transporting ATPase subunit delta